jgi:hypothetical protein
MKTLFLIFVFSSVISMAGFLHKDVYASQIQKEGAYQVIEGNVSRITARMLVVDGQQYPVSMFARVFKDSLRGQEMPLHTLANIGRIDQAKLYLLGGMVEKIVVLKNL